MTMLCKMVVVITTHTAVKSRKMLKMCIGHYTKDAYHEKYGGFMTHMCDKHTLAKSIFACIKNDFTPSTKGLANSVIHSQEYGSK